MRFWGLDKRKSVDLESVPAFQDLTERLHRLEIRCRQLQERFDDLQGRHESLSASVRGRLGGRPNKVQPLTTPLPVGVQHLFPHQEQR